MREKPSHSNLKNYIIRDVNAVFLGVSFNKVMK